MDRVERFAELARLPQSQLDLAEAALALARGGDPALDVARWLAELDRLATGVSDPDGLRRRLFTELGYTGNTSDYYDPENSFLHRVIARRVGIPISLSVLVMEVGRRAGVEIQGIGMPGHFLVRAPAADLYFDPYHGGEALDERGLHARFRAATGADPDVAFGPHLLPIATKHEILVRMLANLQYVYARRGTPADLEWVLRMRLELPDPSAAQITALGRVLSLQGEFLHGARLLERAAAAHPGLAPTLRRTAVALRARLN